MREAIWKFVRRTAEGNRLSAWERIVRALLFPLDYARWRLGQGHGYQLDTDSWLIEGVRYSGEAMRWLARARGEAYRIWREGDVVTLTRFSVPPAMGVGRMGDNEQAVLVVFSREPTDDELRALHDLLRA